MDVCQVLLGTRVYFPEVSQQHYGVDTVTRPVSLATTLWGRHCCQTRFADVDAEAQGREVSCPVL